MNRQRITLGELLTRQAIQHPDRDFAAFLDDDVSLTYGQFNRQVNQFAHALASTGVSKGEHVIVLLRTSPECLVVSYALKKLGAIEVAINADFRGPGLERTIRLTQAALLVTSNEFAGPLSEVPSAMEFVQSILVIGDEKLALAGVDVDEIRFGSILPQRFDEPDVQSADTDPCAVLFTSGTTGQSKGVVMSHRFAMRVAEGLVDALEITESDCFYTPLPLYHYGAAYHDVLGAMLAGARIALRKRFSLSKYWSDVRAAKTTIATCHGSDTTLLWNAAPSPDDRNHSMRVMWGGYTVDRQQFEKRFGVRCPNAYGLSDAGNPAIQRLSEVSSDTCAGKVFDDLYDVRIADEFDDSVASGEVGEILLRPKEPDVMPSGYFGMPEYTLEAWRNMWLHTGDIGKLDEHGYLYFLGRRKDVIRHRGENILPSEVEEVLNAHDCVQESVVFGIAGELGDQDVAAVVMRYPGVSVCEQALRDYCKNKMASWMIPTVWKVVDEIPKTATGKPVRKDLLALLES